MGGTYGISHKVCRIGIVLEQGNILPLRVTWSWSVLILGCSINIVLRWFFQKTDDLKENKRSYGIPSILGSSPIGWGCLKVV